MADVIPAPTLKTASPKEYVCPHCGKKEHTPNAVTIAAIEETRAMMRGEIPSKRYHSLDEALADLKNETD
jgi:hypothetical protein